jgi:hypothetical protein
MSENKCAEMITYPDMQFIDTIACGEMKKNKKTRALLHVILQKANR